MTKKRISCILLGLAVALSAVFAGVLPQSFAPVNAETFDYSKDLAIKVANLPQGDTQNLYVINSDSEEVVKISLKFVYSGKEYIHTLISLFDGDLRPYAFNGFGQTDNYAAFMDFWNNASVEYDYSNYDLRMGVKNKISSLGKSFSQAGSMHIDVSKTGRQYVTTYTNLVSVPWSFYDTKGAAQSVYQVPLYSSVRNYADYPQYSDADLISTPYLYIAYAVPQYLVSFEYLDGTGDWTSETRTYNKGDTITDPPEIPAVPYATSLGWNQAFAPVTANTVYRVQYTYDKFRVIFNNRDNTVYSQKTVTYYDNFPIVSMGSYTVREGTKENTYAFDGWTTSPGDSSLKIDTSSFRVTGDLMLYPLFTLRKSVDLETGKTEHFGDENTGFFGAIVNFFDSVRNVPVIGGVLYWLLIIVCVSIAIPLVVLLIRCIIRLVRAIISLVQQSVAKRRGR